MNVGLLRLNNKSRMSRPAQVRFCERQRGKFLLPTRLVLMGERITQQAKEKLQELLSRMGLKLNETKTRHIEAKEESFNFLGFTVRYDKGIKDRNKRYWNIEASDKSEKKIRENIKEYLNNGGHYAPKSSSRT